MFDAHAHIGEYRNDAIICTSDVSEYADAEKYPLHSYGILSQDESAIRIIENLLEKDRSAFIGEFGPDARCFCSIGLIRTLLELAKTYSRPFSLHVVRRHNEMLRLLKEIRPGKPFIVHAFTSSAEIADEYEKLGGLISLGKRSLRTKDFSRLIRKGFLIESDMPCGPDADKALEEVYNAIASSMRISTERLEEMTDERRTVFTP